MTMMITPNTRGLTPLDRCLKRSFDFTLALVGILLFGWLIALAWLAAAINTGKNGFFTQTRVGRNRSLFKVIKIRTMRDLPSVTTVISTSRDPRITPVGRILRRTKVDELPQLFNVLLGQMSFVGPRPDVPGFADALEGEDEIVLSIRPGITGPASLKYRDEEILLAGQADPERYNREVIFPDKVRINREYIERYRLLADIKYIIRTVLGT